MNGYTINKSNKPLNVSATTVSTLFDSLQGQRGSEIHDSQWSYQFSLNKSYRGYDGLDNVVSNQDEANVNASVFSSQSTSQFNLPSPFRTKQVLQAKKQQ